MKFIAQIEIEVPDGIAEFMGQGNVASALASDVHQTFTEHYREAQDVVEEFDVVVLTPDGGKHGFGWSERPEVPAPTKVEDVVTPSQLRTRVVSKPAAGSARKVTAVAQKAAPARTAASGKGSAQPVRMGRPPFKRDANGNKIPDGKGGFKREWEPGGK